MTIRHFGFVTHVLTRKLTLRKRKTNPCSSCVANRLAARDADCFSQCLWVRLFFVFSSVAIGGGSTRKLFQQRQTKTVGFLRTPPSSSSPLPLLWLLLQCLHADECPLPFFSSFFAPVFSASTKSNVARNIHRHRIFPERNSEREFPSSSSFLLCLPLGIATDRPTERILFSFFPRKNLTSFVSFSS